MPRNPYKFNEMSTMSEITALRRQGKLKEAFRLAEEMQIQEPGEWADTAMFWVLRDMFLENDRDEESKNECLERMKRLLPTMKDDKGVGKLTVAKLQRAQLPNAEEIRKCTALSKTNPCQAYEEAVACGGKQAERLNAALHEDFGWILYRYLKDRADGMSSVEVRTLLRDYLCLNVPRPSMLHSMILHFALGFAKNHAEFLFPKFLRMWGLSNFRKEDLKDGINQKGESIPSLVSRVCACLSMNDDSLIDEMAATLLRKEKVVEMYRKPFFWTLFDLQKNNAMEEFWNMSVRYARLYGAYPATPWHSEIVKLVVRKAEAVYAGSFLDFMRNCAKAGFCEDDWLPEEGKEGRMFPPLAVQFAKKGMELLKMQTAPEEGILEVLVKLYDLIEEQEAGDEWTARQRAMLALWTGDREGAVVRYRKLLRRMGDKFYVWQEMAQCVENNALRMGLLLHALELEKSDALIGPLRLQTVEALLEAGCRADAKKYLDEYAAFRRKTGKPCGERWKLLEERCDALEVSSEKKLDKKQAVLDALEYAYADCPWEEFVLVDRFVVEGKMKVVMANNEVSFQTSAKRVGIGKRTELGTVLKMRLTREDGKVIPLDGRKENAPLWSVFPEEWGYVVYVNEPKSAVSVVTSASEETFFFDKRKRFKAGDFISFRSYVRQGKEGKRKLIVCPRSCEKEKALAHFTQRVVVVDGVNEEKSLFHIVMGVGMVSDVVSFKDTCLRPAIGDFLRLTYCLRKNKKGEKRIVVLDMQSTDETNSKLCKEVEGWLEVKSKSFTGQADFGFVNNVYVPKSVLDKYEVIDDCEVRVKAVVGADGKWRAFWLSVCE